LLSKYKPDDEWPQPLGFLSGIIHSRSDEQRAKDCLATIWNDELLRVAHTFFLFLHS
jgi:hypothetical protein